MSKPVTRLIDKVSDAVGVLYEPTRIRRIGEAKRDAALADAKSEMEIADLRERARRRSHHEQIRHQKNIEDILALTLPQIADDGNPDEVDDDWISNLFAKCRSVSNEEMQSVWSRILASEVNAPGSFSRRTVNAVESLSRQEAELFTKLCGYACSIGKDALCIIPVVLDPKDEIYAAHDIHHEVMEYLDGAGLVHYGGVSHTGLALHKGDTISYYDDVLVVREPGGKFGINGGIVTFTTIGLELFPICGRGPVAGFPEYLREKWAKHLSV